MPKQRSKFDESMVQHFDRAFHNIISNHKVNLRHVLSPFLHNMLLSHSKRYEIDFVGYSYELIGIASYYLKSSYVYRYKSCDNPAPTHFYQLLIALSAFGKSTVHTLLKSAVMNEYSVRTNGEMYDHRKSAILEGFDAFVDETSAAGLQAGLVNGDKMIFSDEGENILKNNGLLVDENVPTSSAYDLHNFVLSYYGSLRTFNKELKSGSLTANVGRLTISCLSTSEPIIRMLARRFSGGAISPMLERFIILYAETKPKYSFQRSKPIQYTMASLSQYVMVLGQIYDANFYFDDDAEYLYASYGDALTYAMKQNERNAPWLSTRLGKSRDHSLRLCALIQSLEMAAVVCHQVFMEDSTFIDGVANKQFFTAIVKKINELFFPSANSQRRLSIGIEIVQSSIYLTNKIIDQYRQMFEPNKREINRMELSLLNVINPIEKKQANIKRKQADLNQDEEYLEDEVDDTSIQYCSKKLTNKQVRGNQMSAKAVSMFNPTSDDGIKIIKLILLANAAVLTKSVWSRHPTLKNYIPLLVPALDHLIDIELLILFDRGAIVTSNEHRLIPVYVKKMISPSCAKENIALSKILKSFKVEHSDYVATWANINLSQTITLTEDIYDLLTSAPYSTFLGDTINQWAPKSRRKSCSMISVSQPNDHAEATESAILPSKTTTKQANFGINTISKKVIGPSNNISVNPNRNDCIGNTETLNNIDSTCQNTAVNQQQLLKTTTSTSTIPDESAVDQENCQIKQMNAKHASMINACLPPLPSGNLPTAINLMLTRQPPLKKKK